VPSQERKKLVVKGPNWIRVSAQNKQENNGEEKGLKKEKVKVRQENRGSPFYNGRRGGLRLE